MTAPVVAVRELRVRVRADRRAHHDKSMGDFLTDLYVLGLLAAMYGYALVHAARGYLHGSGGRGDPAERYWIGVAALLAAAGLAWRGLRAIGPLLVSPAAYAFCAATPVDRRGYLLPRLRGLLVGAAAVIGLFALAAAGMAGVPLGWAVLAGAGIGLAAAGLAVAAQAGPRAAWWPRLLERAVIGLGALATVAVVAAHADRIRLATPSAPVALLLAIAGAPLAVVGAYLAVRVLGRLDRATLTAGSQLAAAAANSVVWLDPTMLSGVLEVRRWRRIGRVHSRRFAPGGRTWVLLQAELRRLVRHPSALTVWAALALTQYAVWLAVPSVAGAAHLLGAYLAAGRLAGGLRAICSSPGLRRVLGGDDASVRLVHIVVPALGVIVWWLVTLPAGGTHRGGAEVALVALVIFGVYRSATRKPMTYGGATIDTPFGLIPIDLIRQLTRGFDVLAVAIIIQSLLH